MSNKMMLGLLVTAAVGLGATAASAQEPAVAEYYKPKAAVIDKDDHFCKVPLKVKNKVVVLSSYDVKIDKKIIKYDDNKEHYNKNKHDKRDKYLLVTCKFKDDDIKKKYLFYRNVEKKGFLCKADLGDKRLKTEESYVNVDFKKWGKVAKVYLACIFKIEKEYEPKPHEPKPYEPKPY